jgi:uncharacterized protein YqeY
MMLKDLPPTGEAAVAVSLRDRITSELNRAMKARDAVRVSTLRLVHAAVHDRDIAARASDRTGCEEAEIAGLLAKMVKQREQSSKIYDAAGRPELADREREEIAVIRELLPEQLDGEALQAAARAVVDELGASGLKDMGRSVEALKARYPGRINVATAAAEIKRLLS